MTWYLQEQLVKYASGTSSDIILTWTEPHVYGARAGSNLWPGWCLGVVADVAIPH